MAPRKQRANAPHWAGLIAGLLSAGLAVSAATFIAVLLNVDTPINAVGSEFIDHTPKWLKISDYVEFFKAR